MVYDGDYDDAVNFVDMWLQQQPGQSSWEREVYPEGRTDVYDARREKSAREIRRN